MTCIPCSVCGNEFDPRLSVAAPFCSVRCQQIDLGRWLNEKYGLPCETDDESETQPLTD